MDWLIRRIRLRHLRLLWWQRVTTLDYSGALAVDCGGHRKIYVRFLSLDSIVAFGGEMQSTDAGWTQRYGRAAAVVGSLDPRM